MAYHDTYHRTAAAFLSPVLGWVLALTGAVVLPLTVATALEAEPGRWHDQSPGLYTVRITEDTAGKQGVPTPRTDGPP
ncbi:hypothetical protein ACSNOJ_09495 [Streptomyces sp. URMC 128]|uniref:hypothetical protein n=1 Tax=Streptomyces sp. URMC 128 TaxID=3423404 RepID=UPI003F1E4584